jgi:diaminopimelate decarboxylase
MKVYLTGWQTEPHGQAGIGLARAIRLAYPHVHLVAVMYAPDGAAIQWPECDETWVVGSWPTLDLAAHQRQIAERLAGGAWWIAGLAREVAWLARALPGHGRLLIPPAHALERVGLPAVAAASDLGLAVPAFLGAAAPDWDLNAFGRRHGWQVWLRTHDGASQRVQSWQALHRASLDLGEATLSGNLFLQEHIEGAAESIAFAALQGELVGCVRCVCEPGDAAPQGALRSSRVEPVPGPLSAALAEAVRQLQWSGGGELRLLRDATERRWVLAWRACFPAWIYGAALAGENLPAQLLERATGIAAVPSEAVTDAFMRVVIEVPLRRTEGAPAAGPDPLSEERAASTVPHGPDARTGVRSPYPAREGPASTAVPKVPADMVADVASAVPSLENTPAWLFLPSAARHAFQQAEELMRRCSTPDVRVRIAYSTKTNPDRRLLELACASGLLVETISQAETRKALACGFVPDRIVLNGPSKRWPALQRTPEPLHAVFCDSLEELRAAGAAEEDGVYHAQILGIRLRAPQMVSRFGIACVTPEDAQAISALVRQLPSGPRFGVHFHMASNAIGLERWWRLFERMLEGARVLETAAGRPVSCLDLGGGWFPDDWTEELAQHLSARIVGRLASALPGVREVILEPGRALSQSSMALAVRVLEVRRAGDGQIGDVVVDGSIAELAYHNYTIFPHRILWHDAAEQRWRPVGRGPGRILGRLCMEKDILAEAVGMPSSLAAGDLLVICDAGAYDRSMSYSFGTG